jgi:hypothetical protein
MEIGARSCNLSAVGRFGSAPDLTKVHPIPYVLDFQVPPPLTGGQDRQGRGQALMTLFGEVSGWAEASRLTEGLIDARIVH